MDLLKRKLKGWDFQDGAIWKKNKCASKSQRKLIKKKYRALKRSAKNEMRNIINKQF